LPKAHRTMDRAKVKDGLAYRLAGIVSGLLLMAGNLYPNLVWLQIIALVPILYLCANEKVRRPPVIIAGLYMGLAYTLPQMIVLRLPIAVTLLLLVYLTALLTVFAWGCSWLLRGRAVLGALAAGSLFVVLDWVNFTVVPIWGTAQSFVRCWSRYPELIQFVSLTGITGIIFVLTTLQALAVIFIIRPKLRIGLFGTAVIIVLVFAGLNVTAQQQQPIGRLKVAAVGWLNSNSSDGNHPQTPEGFDALFEKPVAKAVKEGVKLIVTPEMGFYFDKYNRSQWLQRLRSIARQHNVFLAVGYFDMSKQKNQLVFITPDDRQMAEYSKTRLTPIEHYNKGNGRLKTIEFEGVQVGGMICQDDNFTDFSREYGRKAVSVVVVPTLDWLTVKDAHFQNSIHRAIESRYAIVRAAADGISAIISPTGRVLAQRDHFIEGPGVIVAEVPLYRCRTVFSIAGHWLAGACFVFLIVYTGWRLKNYKGTENG